jgi:hypothetical protein
MVLHSLPVPAERHSFEDVLAFRDESKTLRLGLRDWMNEVGKGERRAAEVSDKLDYLVSQFDHALKVERMARDTTMLETLIFPVKGTVEYLTTLGSKLFTVRRAKIVLMKAQMTLPGREVA